MDNQKALELLEQVVAEKGDGYVYERVGGVECQYALYDDDDQPVAPSCLVGHWAVKAGVPLSAFRPFEGRSADGTVPMLGLDISMFDPIGKALQAAQNLQDQGLTWGEALVAAKEWLA